MRKYLLATTAMLVMATPAAAKDNSGYFGGDIGAVWPKSQSINGLVNFSGPVVCNAPPGSTCAAIANIGDTDRYATAVRDWAERGADSPFVLSEAEVIERSRPRPVEFGLAAAHFELAQHLHRSGFARDAVPHFAEAHRLDPTNWSYHREALSLVDPEWGQVYERDMLSEVETVGIDTFYPALDM